MVSPRREPAPLRRAPGLTVYCLPTTVFPLPLTHRRYRAGVLLQARVGFALQAFIETPADLTLFAAHIPLLLPDLPLFAPDAALLAANSGLACRRTRRLECVAERRLLFRQRSLLHSQSLLSKKTCQQLQVIIRPAEACRYLPNESQLKPRIIEILAGHLAESQLRVCIAKLAIFFLSN